MDAYLTLDYELFMGVSGTPQNCLIKPMESLQSILNKYNIKCTIFVDVAYILRLKQLKEQFHILESDYNLVCSHVKELSQCGHSIQLHFHPQWLYSIYDEKIGWVLDLEHYKLDDMSHLDCRESLSAGIALLEELSESSVHAFRAGGYSYPSDSSILRELGIKIDSSALPGQKCKTKFQSYDYSNCPDISRWNYDVSPSGMKEDGYFSELPISLLSVSGIEYMLIKLDCKKRCANLHTNKKWGDGYPIDTKLTRGQKYWKIITRLLGQTSISASIDTSFVGVLESVYMGYKTQSNKHDFVVIGHPKNQSPYSQKCFEDFIINHPEINWKII